MMKKVVKQVLGVDVAQNELVVTLGRMHDDFSIELYAYSVFKNNEAGITALIKWVQKLTVNEVSVRFVMEATGVYHQKFAYYLDEQGFEVIIVLPNKISNYIRTLEIKTITDKTCSEAIARFGLERNLDLWTRPKEVYKQLQQLTRERDQLVAERVVAKNQLHAEENEAFPNKNSIKRVKARIRFLNQQEKEIKQDIDAIVNCNQDLKNEIDNICTIPGVGQLTAVIVLAETNGFELIRNKRQLVSYSGLDVREKTSGTSVKGKPRISKKGNRNLRRAMHLPALSAIKYSSVHRTIYARLVSKGGIKMKGVVAVQRKLLELIYILHKNKTVYQADYEEMKREQLQLAAPFSN
jgi:transposase